VLRNLPVEEAAPRALASVRQYREWCRQETAPFIRLPGVRRIFVPERDLDLWLTGARLERQDLPNGGVAVRAVVDGRPQA
jgi:hypothetical protein